MLMNLCLFIAKVSHNTSTMINQIRKIPACNHLYQKVNKQIVNKSMIVYHSYHSCASIKTRNVIRDNLEMCLIKKRVCGTFKAMIRVA